VDSPTLLPLYPWERGPISTVQEPIQWVFVYFLGMKRPEPVVTHSPSSSAKVGNKLSLTSTLFLCIHGVEMVNFVAFFHLAFTNLHYAYDHAQTGEGGDFNRRFAEL
jgi:hypothetical protein